MRVVGLDWAVCPSDRAAVVLEKREDNSISVEDVITPVDKDAAIELCECKANNVVAVDIPFAWPIEFREFVSSWRPCCVDGANPPGKTGFRYRSTDRFVHHKTNNSPLHHHLRHAGRLGKIILGDQEIENGKLRMENY